MCIDIALWSKGFAHVADWDVRYWPSCVSWQKAPCCFFPADSWGTNFQRGGTFRRCLPILVSDLTLSILLSFSSFFMCMCVSSFFMCLCVLSAYLSVHCFHIVPRGQEEAVRSSGTRVNRLSLGRALTSALGRKRQENPEVLWPVSLVNLASSGGFIKRPCLKVCNLI